MEQERMEYPKFTPEMKKTHKILIPNMAVTQFRLMAAALVYLVGSLFDDTELMKDFENRLQIMVMFDPLPFDSLDQADQIMLREVGIWGALYGELETSGIQEAIEITQAAYDRYLARVES